MDPRDESEGVDPDQTLAGANGVPVLRHLVRAHTAKSVKIDTIDKKYCWESRECLTLQQQVTREEKRHWCYVQCWI